jgi:hypothetical protein
MVVGVVPTHRLAEVSDLSFENWSLLRGVMSMTNQASERLKGLVKKWREEADSARLRATDSINPDNHHARLAALRQCASDLESMLGEPSDELPMVDGIAPQIRKVAGHESWVIDDGVRHGNRLCGDGQWRDYREVRTADVCSWPSYADAVVFLRECAAQAASEPQADPRIAAESLQAVRSGQFQTSKELIDELRAASEPQQAGERHEVRKTGWSRPEDMDKKLDEIEKRRRIYYQDIVYECCRLIDKAKGWRPGEGIVCGTADTPSQGLQNELQRILHQVSFIWRRAPEDAAVSDVPAVCGNDALGEDRRPEGMAASVVTSPPSPAPAAPQEPTKLDWLRKRCADFTTAWGQCAKAADCSSDRKATLVTCAWQLQSALKELMAAEMAEAKNAPPQAEPRVVDL